MAAKAGADKPKTGMAGGAVAPPLEPDNINPLSEKEQQEAAFLRHMAALRQVEQQADEAKGALKAVNKVRNRLRGEAKRDGFMLKLVDEILEAETKTRVDLAKEEAMRTFMRETVGLPTYQQADLFDRLPQEKQDEESWGNHGYNTGLRGLVAKPPTEMPARFHQRWMERWTAGKERLDWAQAANGINPERKGNTDPPRHVPLTDEPDDDDTSGPVEAQEDPHWDAFDVDPEKWTPGQREVAQDWFDRVIELAKVEGDEGFRRTDGKEFPTHEGVRAWLRAMPAAELV